MKQLFLLLIGALVFLSCSENQNKIEPDYEKVYLSVDDVSEFKGPLKETLDLDFAKLIELAAKHKKDDEKYFTAKHRLFINESGKVDRIKVLSDEVTELNKKIAEAQIHVEFNPALQNGVQVKSKYDWIVLVPFDKNSMTELEKTLTYLAPEDYKVTVEKNPQPIGGIAALAQKVVYPETAKNAGVQGRVFIKAFIDENGTVVKTEVLKGIGAGCDEAAIEAVKNTKFTPGMDGDTPVKTQVAIPILFKLQ